MNLIQPGDLVRVAGWISRSPDVMGTHGWRAQTRLYWHHANMVVASREETKGIFTTPIIYLDYASEKQWLMVQILFNNAKYWTNAFFRYESDLPCIESSRYNDMAVSELFTRAEDYDW